MKKIFLTSLFVLLGFISIKAQDYKNAGELLKAVVDKVAGFKNFEADLSYTMVNKDMDINEEKNGKIFVEGDKYRIEMPGQIIISDGKTLWTYIEDSEEVMISNVEDNDQSLSPTKILTSYNKNYDAKFAEDFKYKKGNLKLIYLKPDEKGNNFEKMSVLVDKKNLELKSFSVYDNNGNVFTYNILNLKPNINLHKDTFTFDVSKYPDVEVVDMR